MEYSVFRECILGEICKILGEDYVIRLNETTKNNNIKLWSVIIKKREDIVAPAIYLEEYYEKYLSSICDIKTIALEIIECFWKHKDDISFDTNTFKNFNEIKNNIRCKLINTEKNNELLNEIPHIEFLDLSIIFYCVFMENAKQVQTCVIRNSHMNLWDTDEKTLFSIAKENTVKHNGFVIKSMKNVIDELLSNATISTEENETDILEFMEKDDDINPIYVLTNKQKTFGAVCILYNNLLRKFSKLLNNDFYIIPSSIHEVILIPCKYQDVTENNDEITKYNEMLNEINETQVPKEEILSDNIYLYKRDSDEIVIP